MKKVYLFLLSLLSVNAFADSAVPSEEPPIGEAISACAIIVFSLIALWVLLNHIKTKAKKQATVSVPVIPTLKVTMGSEGNPLTIPGTTITPENIDFIKAMIKKNVLSITTVEARHFPPIKSECLPFIEDEIFKAMSGKGDLGTLKEAVQRICGISAKQAKLIAIHQSSKIYSQLSIENMRRAGITKVKWLHSSAGRTPREYHKTLWDGVSHNPPNGLNGYIFDLNKPPIADLETGERAMPGELLECRCIAVCVLDI
jgi:hypothetical protein